MEDSLKGFLTVFVVVFIFILALVNFIILFPSEQGFVFNGEDNGTYLILNSTISQYTYSNLSSIEGNISSGFNDWDIEVGYMGSNTQKVSKTSINDYITRVVTVFKTITYEVFSTSDGSTHPVVIVLGILLPLITIYLVFIFIKWIRSGN